MKKLLLISGIIALSSGFAKANSIQIINPHACTYIVYVNAVGWINVPGNSSNTWTSAPGEIINSARITYQTMSSGGTAYDGLLLTNIWTIYNSSTLTGGPVPYCGYNSMLTAVWNQPSSTSDIVLVIS